MTVVRAGRPEPIVSNANLPFTGFPHRPGRAPVRRVGGLDGHAPTPPGHDPSAGDHGGRMIRRMVMASDEASAHVAEWTAGGATPVETPPGWRAWGRVRHDTLSGAPRAQRVALGTGDPAPVVHWSAPYPLRQGDEDHWAAALAHAAPAHGADPAGAGAGWAA